MTEYMREEDIYRLISKLMLDEKNLDIQEAMAKDISKSLDGWVKVEHNKIHVHNASSGGKSAMISAIPPLELIKNGIKVKNSTVVSSTDSILWKVSEEPMFEIIVSDDKMIAYFKLNALVRYRWFLLDQARIPHAYLKAEKDPSRVSETLQFNEIVTDIVKLGILNNLDIRVIQNELLHPTYEKIAIAKGKPLVPGKDAKLDTFFEERLLSEYNEVEGVVDYRNHLSIPNVTAGEVIAKKTMMSVGSLGCDVYGQVLTPAAVKDIQVYAKDNINLLDDGLIVATSEGRPRITGTERVKYFDISTAYIVSGNVDMETGNICFSGDIVVYGDVMDHMILESLGSIYVSGNVYNATLTATGSIHVKGNIVGSHLYSGYFGVMFNRLYNGTKMLLVLLEQLLQAASLLQEAITKKQNKIKYGQIIQLLIESKLKEIPDTAKEILFVIANIQKVNKVELDKLRQMLELILQPIKLVEHMQVKVLQELIELVRETNEEVARMQEPKAIIEIRQCHLSTLKANGDIIIVADGVVQSELYSSRNIIFQSLFSVCRGSTLESEGFITAMIVGGQTGTGTNTVLKAKRRVSIRKMYTGRVCVGRYCVEIMEMIEHRTFEAHTMRSEAFLDTQSNI
ncbi:FapA family protein [Paenibacillus psychroresistens]|nr:FapA family protein [Paenibacillus psychroresistens]